MRRLLIAAVVVSGTLGGANVTLAGEISVTDIKVKVLKKELEFVSFSILCTAKNGTDEPIKGVLIRGLDKDGFEVEEFPVMGAVKAGETKQLTAKLVCTDDDFRRIVKWEHKR